jgi:hypothetical protein
MVPGLPVVDHMMVTCRGHLFFSILVAKIVYEPAGVAVAHIDGDPTRGYVHR